jgi:hypothetical protein
MYLPHSGVMKRVVGVLDDEGGHADCGEQWSHVRLGHPTCQEGDGRWACRQTLVPCPGRPDLVVPRHIRIREMRELPRAPHRNIRGDGFLKG